MNQLSETLDSMKGEKIPGTTLFGGMNAYVPTPYRQFKNLENPGYVRAPRTGIREMGERWRKYGRFVSKLTTVKELLAELSDALAGREEAHDCTGESCPGCEAIAEILSQ
jgi:hypothetical protein